MFHYRSLPVFRIGYRLLSITLVAAALQAGTITVGAPGADGIVNLTITLPDGTEKKVAVPITKDTTVVGFTHTTTAADKAGTILNALEGVVPGAFGSLTPGKAVANLPGSTIVLTGDTTNETMTIADLGTSTPGTPEYAMIGFNGPISPFSTDGTESTFTASFGVDDTTFSSATVTYSQLSNPTSDGLTTAIYYELLAGLSPDLQPNLHLNLSTDSVRFDFAPGSGTYFASSSATSPGTSQFLAVQATTATPEPVSCISLGTGLVLIGLVRKRSRRSGAQ